MLSEQLHSGGDEGFDTAYKRVYQRYFALLKRPDAEEAAEPKPEKQEEQTVPQEKPATEQTPQKDAL